MILENSKKSVKCDGIGFDDEQYIIRYIYGTKKGKRIYFEKYTSQLEGEEEYARLKKAFNKGNKKYKFCGDKRFTFDL